MLFNGLKIRIAATLFILLAIALLLGNLVFLAFWQRAMVRAEVEHVEAVFENSQQFLSGLEGSKRFDYSIFFNKLCHSASRHCLDVALLDASILQGGDVKKLENKVSGLLRKTADTGERIVELDGSAWSILFNRSRYLFISEPLSLPNMTLEAVVFVLEIDSLFEVIKKDQKVIFVYLLVNLLILSIVGFYRLVGLIVRPIEQMIKMTDTYQASENVYFSAVKEHSEFGQLNIALNNMLTRIESDKDMLRQTIENLEESNQELVKAHNDIVRAEKLASVGQLSAGFAHEIGNPIGIIQGYVELLKQPDISQEDKDQYGSRALEELGRVEKLVRQLLDYAATSSRKFSEVRLDEELFNVVLDLARMQKRDGRIKIETKIEPDLSVVGNREGLQQVFLNCILNALDAIEAAGNDDGGLIELSVGRTETSARQATERVLVTIVDNGIGFDADDSAKQFDPFFTTKEPGKGTGLGLFVSHFIIETHGGTMKLVNNSGGGAAVMIFLPLSEAGQNHG